MTLKIRRGGQPMEVSVTATSVTRPTMEIQEDPAATDAQKALREFWLYRGKKGWHAPN